MTEVQEVAEANYTVYEHKTPNGKRYIGITSQKPEKRWLNGRGYKSNEYLYNAIKKYGWENIEHSIIKTKLTKEEAEKMEKELIAFFHSNEYEHGYNWADGGSAYRHSIESRKKMSEAHKGLRYNIGVPFTEERKKHLRENHADVRGEKNPMYGKKKPAEEIARRLAHRVYKVGGEHPTARKICQYTMDNKLVKVWGSISEASKVYCRTSLKDCLKGKYKQHRGYVWRYYDETR